MLSGALFALLLRCSGVAANPSVDVWLFEDITQLTCDAEMPRYVLQQSNDRLYLSEIIAERRMDYICDDDLLMRWVGEQTSLLGVRPTSSPVSLAFGTSAWSTKQSSMFEAHGYYGNVRIAEVGVFESIKPTTCRVVMGNDTISAMVSTEKREFIAKISHSDIEMPLNTDCDSLETYTITRRRWFTADNPVLIAVQTISESRAYNRKQAEVSSNFYTISQADFLEIADKQHSYNKDIFKGAQIKFENGYIKIRLPNNANNEDIWVDVSLTSLDGTHCPLFGMRFAGTEYSQQDVSALAPGQYLLTLRTNAGEHKQLIVKP